MKKILIVILNIMIFSVYLVGCGQQPTTNSDESSNINSGQTGTLNNPTHSESEDNNMDESNQAQPMDDTSIVYFTSDITPEGLIAVYEKII